MKKCSKCGIKKPFEEFQKDSSKKDGMQSYCKGCIREARKAYKLKYPERIKERGRKYYLKNSESIKEYRREYYSKNPELVRSQVKLYESNNKEKRQTYRNNYYKNKRQTDPAYKLRVNISRMIHHSLKMIIMFVNI